MIYVEGRTYYGAVTQCVVCGERVASTRYWISKFLMALASTPSALSSEVHASERLLGGDTWMRKATCAKRTLLCRRARSPW